MAHDDATRISTSKGSEQTRNNINMEAYQAYYNTNEAGSGKNEAQFATKSPQPTTSP